MSEPIRVLVSVSDNYGISLYRVKEPHIALQKLFPDDFIVDIVDTSLIPWNDINYFKDYQILFSHRQFVPDNMMEEFCYNMKQINVITILDYDDYWELYKTHPLYHVSKQENMADKLKRNIKCVDYITTTTPVFANYIKDINKNVIVLPNGVDDNLKQYAGGKEKEKSDKVRIMWSGGSSHIADIELLRDGFNLLSTDQKLKDQFQLHLVGFDLRGSTTNLKFNPELEQELKAIGWPINKQFLTNLEHSKFDLDAFPSMPETIRKKYKNNAIIKESRDITPKESVWYEYEKIFTNNYKLIKDPNYVEYLNKFNLDENYPNVLTEQPYVRHKTQGIYKFAENYKHADVALAPLMVHGKVKDGRFDDSVGNRFQFAKSNLKVIEAGIHKVPVIASDVPTYNYDKDFVDGKNILFVKPERQEKDWYGKIKRLIQNPNQITDMGEAAYEIIKSKYHVDVIANKRAEFYKDIVDKHNKI